MLSTRQVAVVGFLGSCIYIYADYVNASSSNERRRVVSRAYRVEVKKVFRV